MERTIYGNYKKREKGRMKQAMTRSAERTRRCGAAENFHCLLLPYTVVDPGGGVNANIATRRFLELLQQQELLVVALLMLSRK